MPSNERYRDLCLRIFNTVEAETKIKEEGFGVDFSSLSLKLIDKSALDKQEQWPLELDYDKQIGWCWEKEVMRYRQNYMARIELAIWFGPELCGLMLGKASKGRLVVKVNFLQGSTDDNHPLKGRVATISIRCAELFADAIEAEWVGIENPAEGLIEHYEKLGFDKKDPYDPRSPALYRKLEES